MLGTAHRSVDVIRRRYLATATCVAVALVVVLGVALTRHPRHSVAAATEPTDAQARALLLAKFDVAQRHDMVGYCGDTSSPEMCANHWDRAGGVPAVPTSQPRIAGSRAEGGYRALRVCGTDGLGRAYRSDFLVQLHGGRPQAVLAVFWSDRRWSGVFNEGEEPTSVTAGSGGPTEDC